MIGRRRFAGLAVLAVLSVLVVAAIVSVGAFGFATSPQLVHGGRAGLPSAVPAGVSFAPEASGAPKAPDFEAALLDGTRVTGSELWAGRPVVLVFFASWCGTCAAIQDDLNGSASSHQGSVAFLGIATEDTPHALGRYLDDHRVPYAVTIDPDRTIWRKYAVEESPLVAVIGPSGRLIKGWPGGVDRATLDAVLNMLVVRQ